MEILRFPDHKANAARRMAHNVALLEGAPVDEPVAPEPQPVAARPQGSMLNPFVYWMVVGELALLWVETTQRVMTQVYRPPQ